jgi:ethanolamine ammonia-lyase small subunit
MINERELKEIVEKVIKELEKEEQREDNNYQQSNLGQKEENYSNQVIDITNIDLKKQFLVDNAENKEAFLKLKENTSARLGVGRAGPRYKTETLLRFRADHAAAMDAVFTDVSDKLIEEMNLFKVKTLCRDKDEYLKRPDLGKSFLMIHLQKFEINVNQILRCRSMLQMD